MADLSRRDVFKIAGVGAALGALHMSSTACATKTAGRMLPPAKGNRVVIIGGGWAGMTAAKHLKKELGDKVDVVLIEKRKIFMSCPISNVWLGGLVDMEFLMHDFHTPAAKYGYTFINATVTDIDRDRRRVYTTDGYVDYDYLILAPGIRYNYDAWFKGDKKMAQICATHFPSAFIPGSEHIALKRKVDNFEEGTFILTVPPPPHRCPPAPYERAAMIAHVFKKNEVNGKLIILDPKGQIKPKGEGFGRAYQELYLGLVEYVPNAKIKEVDPVNKVIKTTAGDFKFDDANINPPHQAGDLAWKAGLVNPKTGWCDVNPLTLQSKLDPRVFVAGDASSVKGFPKSGDMAHNHTQKMVVKALVALLKGKDPLEAVQAPTNTCYSMVNGDPKEAIVINVLYDIDRKKKAPVKKKVNVVNDRSTQLARSTFEWAKALYRDMFS
ncbi:MAG: NAD(P)/FAD-dependent oxidoreductase [Aquificae bacterium]|nr:NAD(P)/FAD-dependent oxidoreductase [Aquificota bacterium]